jgi:hypothetical protein
MEAALFLMHGGESPPAPTTATGEIKNIGAYNHGTTNKDSKMR